jgi:predicted CXXCH cytochrome family protein
VKSVKKTLAVLGSLAVLVWLVAMTGDAYAQFGNKVKDTPHNLRIATTNNMGLTDLGEVCVYCHTPHNNNTTIEAPLWNRSTPAGPYTMYSSNTIDMTIASSPQGASLACLSCHDNTIALDQVVNVPSDFTGTPSGNTISSCVSCHQGDNPPDGLNFEGSVIGTDLTNDHPISVTYDPTKDPNFNSATNGKVNGLPLYGPNQDQVECASCHNPHDNSKRPFLRMDNTDSALCLACHDI